MTGRRKGVKRLRGGKSGGRLFHDSLAIAQDPKQKSPKRREGYGKREASCRKPACKTINDTFRSRAFFTRQRPLLLGPSAKVFKKSSTLVGEKRGGQVYEVLYKRENKDGQGFHLKKTLVWRG